MQVVAKAGFAIATFFNSTDHSTIFSMRLLNHVTFALVIFNSKYF